VIHELPGVTLRWPIGHGLRLTALPQNATITAHCREARTAVLDGISVARLAVRIATEGSLCVEAEVTSRACVRAYGVTEHPAPRRS
jgi:hypothetical protein